MIVAELALVLLSRNWLLGTGGAVVVLKLYCIVPAMSCALIAAIAASCSARELSTALSQSACAVSPSDHGGTFGVKATDHTSMLPMSLAALSGVPPKWWATLAENPNSGVGVLPVTVIGMRPRRIAEVR